MPRHPIACALLLWYLPACTSWHAMEGVSPKHVIATKHPHVVRVTRPDSSHMVLYEPKIAGDSLSGVRYRILSGHDVRVAVSDVTQIEIRKVHAGKTTWLVTGIVVVSVAAYFVVVSWLEHSFGCYLSCVGS